MYRRTQISKELQYFSFSTFNGYSKYTQHNMLRVWPVYSAGARQMPFEQYGLVSYLPYRFTQDP